MKVAAWKSISSRRTGFRRKRRTLAWTWSPLKLTWLTYVMHYVVQNDAATNRPIGKDNFETLQEHGATGFAKFYPLKHWSHVWNRCCTCKQCAAKTLTLQNTRDNAKVVCRTTRENLRNRCQCHDLWEISGHVMLAAVYRVCDAAKLYGLCQRVTPIVVYNLHVRIKEKKKNVFHCLQRFSGHFLFHLSFHPA